MDAGTMTLLTVLTIVLVLALAVVLVAGLTKIDQALERIGGASRGYMGEYMGGYPSLLAKARWGVRAIEVQTSAIAPEVTRLNECLAAIDGGLGTIREGVGALVEAVKQQEGGAG